MSNDIIILIKLIPSNNIILFKNPSSGIDHWMLIEIKYFRMILLHYLVLKIEELDYIDKD